MAWLTLLISSKAMRVAMPLIAGVAMCAALVVGWRLSVSNAYDRGFAAAVAEQKAVNAEAVITIVKEYTNATDPNLSDDAVDCILRRISGVGADEDCGDL